jgi:hypothetical protein
LWNYLYALECVPVDAEYSTSQVIVEKKLNKFLQEFQDGKHEGSVATTQTVESLSMDKEQTWRIIRKELEDIGITVAAFDANRDYIIDWFKEGIAAVAFKEQTPEDISSNQSCKDNLSQFWEDPQYPTTSQSTAELFNPLNIWNTASQDPVMLETQSTQTITTQKAISPSSAFLLVKEPNTNAKTLRTQATQRAPQKAYTKKEYVLQMAALITRVSLYNRRVSPYHKGLINAARQGHEVVMQRLLEKGVDVNVKNEDGETALRLAAENGHEAVVQLLLENGADVAEKDDGGLTALHWATENGHEVVARLLLLCAI